MRYVAFAWDSSNTAQTAQVHELRLRLLLSPREWKIPVDTPGLVVFVDAAVDDVLTHVLENAGLILGRLFDKSYDSCELPRRIEFTRDRLTSIQNSEGRKLFNDYWGSYVAFIRAPVGPLLHVARDPSGGVQCFYLRVGEVFVFFARLSDAECILNRPLTLNWRYIEDHLVHGGFPCADTGVTDVYRLLPGGCLVCSSRRLFTTNYWNPLELYAENPIEDIETARRMLRQAVRAAVHAWASCYRDIILLLSGGLDSAIVLACLRDAPGRPHVVALNYYSRGADSDERAFARIAADEAGVPLIEECRDPSVSWGPLLHLKRSPVPCAMIGTLQTYRQIAEVVAKTSAQVQFTGTGGDLLFYRHAAFLAAAEYVQRCGLGREAYRHALSAAYLDRTSIWTVFKRIVHHGVIRADFAALPDAILARPLLSARLQNRANLERVAQRQSIWRNNLPAGKSYQVRCLMPALSPLDVPFELPDMVPELAPLLSQPVIETCLRIPLYVLMRDGRDRALAREAFRAEIPAAVHARQSKGGVEEHVTDSLLANLAVVKELLIGGRLADAGLIDEAGIRDALRRQPSTLSIRAAQLYEYLNVEAFVRSWCHESRREAF
jgi:asparagine synthase (glutamine-hydrolysing)